MASFTMTADQSVPVTVEFVDDHGNPVVAGSATPVWASSDATILTVVPSADGMSADVSAVGPDGGAQLSVTDTVSGIGGVLSFTIVSGIAASAVITPGAPVATVVPVPTPAPTPVPTPAPPTP
jgi:hypothetical protein